MKGLFEIDCNEDIWFKCTSNLHNGWIALENEIRFAFYTKDSNITEDDIEQAFYDKFETIDQLTVEEVYPEDPEEGTRYFGVSMIIYESGIAENRIFF